MGGSTRFTIYGSRKKDTGRYTRDSTNTISTRYGSNGKIYNRIGWEDLADDEVFEKAG